LNHFIGNDPVICTKKRIAEKHLQPFRNPFIAVSYRAIVSELQDCAFAVKQVFLAAVRTSPQGAGGDEIVR
jgi:hypothetical protein